MIKVFFSKKEKTAAFLLLFANILILLAIWFEHNYDQISFDQLLFQLKTTSKGVHTSLLTSAILNVGFFSVALTILEAWIYHLLTAALV